MRGGKKEFDYPNWEIAELSGGKTPMVESSNAFEGNRPVEVAAGRLERPVLGSDGETRKGGGRE
jgi:hypothetical protein